MSDLFDRVAMRALGSQANLRPRHRTRFEPILGPEAISSADVTAPTPAIASIDDDPSTAPVSIGDQVPTVTARRRARAATPNDLPNSRNSRSPQPGPALSTEQTVNPADRDATPPHRKLEPQASAAVSAEISGKPAQPIFGSMTSKEASAPASVPQISERPRADAVTSSTASLHADAERTASGLANIEGPTPIRQNSPVAERAIKETTASAPIVTASREPNPTASIMSSTRPEIVGDDPGLTNAEPSVRETASFADPLGVRARARIERRPPEATPRTTPAPVSTPPVEVTIGRLEIRAENPTPTPRATRAFAPHLDLAAYRARKEGKA